MMTDLLQVSTATASREEAEMIGRTVVEERLAACAQIVGPLTSFYHWKGQVEDASEWYCVLKSTADLYPALEARIRSLHPYEIPEVIAVSIERSSPQYAGWIAESVRMGG
jgi:periplasmic divalent cation tolerance protein